jgi:hypothetical protein
MRNAYQPGQIFKPFVPPSHRIGALAPDSSESYKTQHSGVVQAGVEFFMQRLAGLLVVAFAGLVELGPARGRGIPGRRGNSACGRLSPPTRCRFLRAASR